MTSTQWLLLIVGFFIGWPVTVALVTGIGWALIGFLDAATSIVCWVLAVLCPPFRRWRQAQLTYARD